MRGLLEDDAGKPDEAKAESLRSDLVKWIERDERLRGELEPHEAQILNEPIGKPKGQAIIDAVWGAEAAQVLLYALGARPLPSHDAQEHPYKVARAHGVLGEASAALFEATLRPEAELWSLQRRLLAIHWRMVELRVRGAGAVDMKKMAQKEFLRGVDLATIPLADGDLAVRDAPVSQAEAGLASLVQSIALERHRAANWLVGVHPVYSRVATPT
jgi:hypothetical protein